MEITSERTERTRTFRNPDGSMRLEQHARTKWVKRDGGWADVDPTLRFDANGKVVPAVTSAELTFSGGGDTSLADMAAAGKRLRLGWAKPLPKPLLEGSSATYADVLPGVDLKVTADVDGFSQVLIVKTRAAANHPELANLRYDVATEGLTLSTDDAGNVKAKDDKGNVVLQSPTPQMWDSSGRQSDAAALSLPTAAKHASMDVALASGAMTFTPDQALLTGADTTFPVYLDPWVSTGIIGWTTVWAAYPNTSYWNSGDIARVGYESQTGMTNRSFWWFDVEPVRGKQILSATVRANNIHSWSCSAREVQLWITYGIDANTNWNNQPGQYRHLDSRNESHGYSGSCPAATMEFNATSGVAEAISSNWPGITVGLYANESDSFAWKKFDNNPVLSIDYNSPPNAPTNLTVNNKRPSEPRPVIGTTNATMRAVVSDPDPGANLSARFHLNRYNPSTGGWDLLGYWDQNNLPSGATATMDLAVENGRSYFVNVWSSDGATGTWGETVFFDVNTSVPTKAPTVSSSDYGSNLTEIYGAVGKTGKFTFGPNGESNVGGYRWGWKNPPTNDVLTSQVGQSITVPLTPPAPSAIEPTRGGLVTLYVQSLNPAGTPGAAIAEYKFNVGDPTQPVARWNLDEPSGSTTLLDATGNGRNLSASGAQTGSAGRLVAGATATAFDGSNDSASSTGAVVDTSTSFTVATWVKPSVTDDWHTMLSTTGDHNSAFFLRGYRDHWVFSLTPDPNQTAYPADLLATSAPKAGVWAHVAGVYDAGEKKMHIYVDGVLEGSMSAPSVFKSAGPTVLGTARWNGEMKHWFGGSLADVRVWDRVASAAEIQPLAATMVGRWNLDGDGSDALSYGRDLTAAGNVVWSSDRDGSAALDGSSWLSTDQPVLNTAQSYTVAAWVKLNATNGTQTVMAQEGSRSTPFYLQYSSNLGKWCMAVSHADIDNAPGTWACGAAPTIGQWTHITGVFDRGHNQVRMYVNGVLQTKLGVQSSWNSTGKLLVGRAKFSGNEVDHFRGGIDDARAYQGILSDSAIKTLAGT